MKSYIINRVVYRINFLTDSSCWYKKKMSEYEGDFLMKKEDWLNSGFYFVLVVVILFFSDFTSNRLIQFGIAFIGAIVGNLIHKKFIKPKL